MLSKQENLSSDSRQDESYKASFFNKNYRNHIDVDLYNLDIYDSKSLLYRLNIMKGSIDNSLTPELKQNTEEHSDILSSTKQPLSQDNVRRRKSSPRTLSVRKISAGKESRHLVIEHSEQSEDSSSARSSPHRVKKIPAKEHSSSDPDSAAVSVKPSKNKISHKIFKELNSSDPLDTTGSSPRQMSRSKSPRKTAKDYFSSDPMDISLSAQSSRHSSPRSELSKSGKGEGLFNQYAKVDKHGNFSNTSTPKIVLNCSPSSEQEDGSNQFFELNLNTIISERTDEHFHGKVLAYFDPNLLKTDKPKSVYFNRLKFPDYFKYITEDFTQLQRKKYTTIQSLVELLNPVYSQIKRSREYHDKFCENLLEIIRCCMVTNQENYFVLNYLPDSPKIPVEKIVGFWGDAYENIFSNNEASRKYSELIIKLHNHIKSGFLMNVTLEELKNIKCDRPPNDNPLCCIAWDYLNVLCDYQYSAINLESCKILYNEACNGLASEFVYVPHLWDFIRDNLDKEKEVKPHSPLYDTFKKLDKLLMDAPVFSDYKPEEKNHSSLNKWF